MSGLRDNLVSPECILAGAIVSLNSLNLFQKVSWVHLWQRFEVGRKKEFKLGYLNSMTIVTPRSGTRK